ncbi:MAG: hypothetical protein KAU62_00775 [Candidatus Heimdallarchaeota archaeon]|nr:hypothetical protein [Candidatus Heimdallarchaeota archaeon]MCK4609666.1 hypothetical protein [Candidatus Heimdallarchaeota archaeon]
MVLREMDANALILRNFIDFSNKTNQYFLTNLKKTIPDIWDDIECMGEAKSKVSVVEGLKLVKRRYKINNIDIAYIIILAVRGYKFRNITERVFLCEEEAIFPSIEHFPPTKPKMAHDFEIKTAVLKGIIEVLENESDDIAENIIESVPEMLEKSYGVRYTGRFLSINEWIDLKEKEGKWISEDSFKIGNQSLTPMVFGNLLVLQARGWYLQEIPEKFKGNDYLLIRS